jgi:hypothetical protein
MFEQQRHEHASQWATIVSIAAKIGCSALTPDRAYLNTPWPIPVAA